MTRLISGVAGGRRLKVPAVGVRPTGDRAREALFSSLGSLLDLDGARCSTCTPARRPGSGGAVPRRGGRRLRRVRPRVLPVLKANLAAVGLPGGRVIAGSVPTVVAGAPPRPSTWSSPTRPTTPR